MHIEHVHKNADLERGTGKIGVFDLLNGDAAVMSGQRFGFIRFGSRVDTYLPLGAQPLVAIGERKN